MKPETKFKFKVYLIYLFLEPWTEKFSLPNIRTTIWILIIIAFSLKLRIFLLPLIIIGVILYLIREFKSGKFIYWYKQRKYKEQRKALKEVRENKKSTTNRECKI